MISEPMLAAHIDQFPTPRADQQLLYEPKWDGFRCIGRVDEFGGVTLVSRRGKPLKTAFPDIVDAVFAHLPPRTTVDGEIVRWSDQERLDFAALQRRNPAEPRLAAELARAEPAHYVVFDLLEIDGRSLLDEPLFARRTRLEYVLSGLPAASQLTLAMATTDPDEARVWFDELGRVGVEGLVIEDGAGRYRPGSRGWWRLKAHATTEAIIGGVTGSLERPQDLILGRYRSATGALDIVGRTTPLSAASAGDVAAALSPAGAEHPWPSELPPSWASSNRQPVPYVRGDPRVVAEVRVDVATIGDRWRHGLRHLRLRPDLSTTDVPQDLNLEAP